MCLRPARWRAAWAPRPDPAPVTVYPVWLRILVTFVIPIAVATTIPLQGLRGDLSFERALMFIAIGVVSFLIASQVWKRGLKQYSGASS